MSAPEFDPVAFVEQHGIVLVSGQGAVPRLSDAVAGEQTRGSWWSHPRGKAIFAALQVLGSSPDVLFCKLVDGKQTLVHRRLWPALARCASRFPAERVARVRQEHRAGGAHRNVVTPFPDWLPDGVASAAQGLSEAQALAALAVAGLRAPA